MNPDLGDHKSILFLFLVLHQPFVYKMIRRGRKTMTVVITAK